MLLSTLLYSTATFLLALLHVKYPKISNKNGKLGFSPLVWYYLFNKQVYIEDFWNIDFIV